MNLGVPRVPSAMPFFTNISIVNFKKRKKLKVWAKIARTRGRLKQKTLAPKDLSRPPSKLVLKMLAIGCKWEDSQSVHFIFLSIIGQAILGPRRYVWFRQRRIFQHGWWDEISGMRWLRERSNRLPRHQRGKQAILCSPIKSQPHIRILRHTDILINPIRRREV